MPKTTRYPEATREHPLKSSKRYIKFLSIAPNGQVVKSIIKSAPVDVIKSISNAALNAIAGDIALNDYQRKLFGTKRHLFQDLIKPNISPAIKKQKILSQRGKGLFPLIPILLSAVLGTLGSTFFKSEPQHGGRRKISANATNSRRRIRAPKAKAREKL